MRGLIIALLFVALAVIPSWSKVAIKFYSTGVGIEEREVSQPDYPLKLILATKDGSYLAYVTLEIYKGNRLIATIPSSKVKGPWVYISLPDGKYKIVGLRKNGQKAQKSVVVKSGKKKVVYLFF